MYLQMVGYFWLIGVFSLGLMNCYFGYRLFVVTVAILGFLVGASMGYMIGMWTGSIISGLIAVIALGLITGWASMLAYYAFIFVAGAAGFALASTFLAGLYSPNMSVWIPIATGVVGGFSTLWLQRKIIIVATAAQGALASVLAVFALGSGGDVEAYSELFYRLLEGELGRAGSLWFYAGLILWLILAASGAATQFRRGKEMYRRQMGQTVEP